jgi:hypothetical protein
MGLRILYKSIHEVLEFDDLRMFTSRGHQVFSIGWYHSKDNTTDFRVGRDEFYNEALREAWVASVGMSKEFVDLFDVVIVNHDTSWIEQNIDFLRGKPVIYRSIGQSNKELEILLKGIEENIHIVRYSEKERGIPGFARTDSVIYFAKDVEVYPKWTGGGTPLTFHNNYLDRDWASVPSLQTYTNITSGHEAKLFGFRNEGIQNWGGLISADAMMKEFQNCSCYLFVWTLGPSYTLNLMEAMLVGAPIIAPSISMIEGELRERADQWHRERYEVASFLSDKHALIYDTPKQAAEFIVKANERGDDLITMAERIRERARSLFDMRIIGAQWDDLFSRIVQ